MQLSAHESIKILLIILLLSGCGQNKSDKPEELILGEWYTIKGDVEAYSFLKDESAYLFVGTLGMRPVVYGTWGIEKENFVITMDNGMRTEYSFSLANDTLWLNEGSEIYTRTEPLEIKYPEVQILVDIASDFSDMDFSKPQPDNLKWGFWVDSTSTAREFSLKSYSINAASTLSSDNKKDISAFIQDLGFESDTVFISEICDGYWDNNQIVTLCLYQDDFAIGDEVTIKISSGLIVK